MQDIEFTVQKGKLWLLQTRNGKRTARAMVRIAAEMVREGLIDVDTAILRVEPQKLDELLHPTIDPKAKVEVIAQGLPASPGAAMGKVVFSADEAELLAEKGEKVILVRVETSPEDIHGMKASEGILTARGGMTSHAAVVGRGMGKCCVVGCSSILVDYEKERFTTQGGVVIKKGDVVTLDGSRGDVMRGPVPMVPAQLDDDYATVMKWADEKRRLKVRTNADTPADAETARAFGAEGIGLCRTEHMFFEPDRILAVRQMILSDDEAGRRAALAKILPMQRSDFEGIFRAMDGLPVTIRLLDPPLHEFLPQTERELTEVAMAIGVSVARMHEKNAALHEFNPMLGHRGCRLAVTYPEIYEVQVRAILEAAVKVKAEGKHVHPEIMIPIVGIEAELVRMRELVEHTAREVLAAAKADVPFTIGTMIELPRACVIADRIAAHADFFSFGTNDLTQTTFGLSRDDAGRFLPAYVQGGLLPKDPFVALDRDGVGGLMRMARDKARTIKDKLKLGICGEHGGEPSSVEFCHELGLDYVSCSPFRVPIARLAAAHAAVKEARAKK
jgi:pyruvate,orthophosphate dikinase